MTETTIRLTAFFGIFLAMAAWEYAAPRRARTIPRNARWVTNWGISIINVAVSAMLKAAVGAAAVLAAMDAEARQIGLFHSVDWPLWVEVLICFVLLDFAIWFQHLASHKIPILWRLHRVHHADPDIDVTTAIRFHPIEIALSMIFKVALVFALGVPLLAVILFEVVLNGSAMFNHANIRLPGSVDRWLRLAVVTPDMHRVHHSIHRSEHDANYGFNLSIWDRIFRTYIPQPGAGHDGMTIGLKEHQNRQPTELLWSLMFPLRK